MTFGRKYNEDSLKAINRFQQHTIYKILTREDSNRNRYKEQPQYFICNIFKSCQLDGRGIQKYTDWIMPK